MNNSPRPSGGFGQWPGGANASASPGSGNQGFPLPPDGGNPVPYDGFDNNDPKTSNDGNMGLALGLTFGIGAPLLALVIILVVYFCCKVKKQPRSFPEPSETHSKDKGTQGTTAPRRITIPEANKELETINEVAETTDIESTVRSQTPLPSKVEGKTESPVAEEREDTDSSQSQSPPSYATLVTIEDADSKGDEKQPS